MVLKLGFNVPLSKFDDGHKEACATAVANAAQLEASKARVTGVDEAAEKFVGVRRRLLAEAGAITVSVELGVATQEKAKSAAANLGSEPVNAQLAEHGLPAAVVVAAARVVAPRPQATSPDEAARDEPASGGGGGVSWTDIVCPILIVVVLGMGYYVYKHHQRTKQTSIHEHACAGPDPELGRTSLRSEIAHILSDLSSPPARPPPVYEPESSLQPPSGRETGSEGRRAADGAADTRGSVSSVSRECVICMNAQRTTLLRPCGHVCVCSECAEAVSTCPLCRQHIADRIRAFM